MIAAVVTRHHEERRRDARPASAAPTTTRRSIPTKYARNVCARKSDSTRYTRVLREAPRMQLAARMLAVELQRAAPPALEQALDRPEQELHVHRLRARPPAPHASRERRHQKDPDEDAEHSSISSSVSVGKNVEPRIVNRRSGRSSSTSGIPFTRRYGMAKKTTISAYATARRRTQNLPGERLRTDPPARSVLVHRRQDAADRDRRRHFGAWHQHALRRLRVRRVRPVQRVHVRRHVGHLLGLQDLAPVRHSLVEHAIRDRVMDLA